jgi:hypothetical protein
MTLETDFGVPAVGVHADVFSRLVASVVKVNGMPNARRAFVPTPVMSKTRAELRAYIEGNDPTNGRPFTDVLIEALTREIPAEDLRGVGFDRTTPRFVEPDTEDNLQRLFRDNHWTDYLPVVLPTEERVERMLTGTSRRRDEIVGRLRATAYREDWEFDVEKVAVNAVMAGAEPEYFPVILALASSGLTARNSTTSSSAAMVVVNGPIRNEIGMNSGLGALGPYSQANATIGRAYSLLSQNLQGGSIPAETYMGSQGNGYNFTNLTFPENEEKSPWQPFHVTKGFKPEESVATIFYVWGNSWTEGLRDTWEEKLIDMMRGQDQFLGATLVLDPIAAQEFYDRGFDTQQKLVDWIHENVRIPARRYWDSYTARTFTRESAELGEEPFATYMKAAPDDMLPVFEPHQIHVLVVGGSSNGQWSSFNGEPLEMRFRRPTDRHIVSIDEWR